MTKVTKYVTLVNDWQLDGIKLTDLIDTINVYRSEIAALGGYPNTAYLQTVGGGYYSIRYKRLETDAEYNNRKADESDNKEYAAFCDMIRRSAAERPEFERLLNKFGHTKYAEILDGVK
jgi:hypothetical protein